MPKVGMKNFSYDQSGMDKANEEARRTGLPVEYEDRNYAQYNAGGRVKTPEKDMLKKAGKDLKKMSKEPKVSEEDMLKKAGRDLKKMSKEPKVSEEDMMKKAGRDLKKMYRNGGSKVTK